jgi:hypothetical protein
MFQISRKEMTNKEKIEERDDKIMIYKFNRISQFFV